MRRHFSFVAALLSGALLLACGSIPRAPASAADLAALEAVVESFRASIIRKDKPAFMSLFYSEKPDLITWQSVVDDPSLEKIKQTRPEALKARYRPENNFVAFIDGVVASGSAEEERFSDVRMDTDGEVASVSFDYVYLHDGHPTNHGREKWLLVRTERGWKIISVVYTIRLTGSQGGD